MFVEIIEVNDEVLSESRGQFTFRMEGKVWMIAFVGKEWRDTCSFTRGVVVGEFSERKESGPVFLLVRNVVS